MRSLFVLTALAGLAACDSTTVLPVNVLWMDWPAEVESGQPFRTRLVVWGVCAQNPRFRAGAHADQSAVTFTPYFLAEENRHIACLQERLTDALVVIAIDTAGTAPGLAADSPRTYEMRGAASEEARRTFGEVLVRQSAPDPSRRNGAGYVVTFVDNLGCVRIQPVGMYKLGAALALESQTDTAGVSGAFVRGYIHDVAVPICGETRVFHLESVN